MKWAQISKYWKQLKGAQIFKYQKQPKGAQIFKSWKQSNIQILETMTEGSNFKY